MTIRKFEDSIAWQKGRLLNRELFKTFQDNRNFSFRDQILRAGLSVTNNIAEGFERGGDKELRQFLIISRGSAAEVRSMLYIANDNGYIDEERFNELLLLTQVVGKLLTGFIKQIKTNNYQTVRQ